MYCDQTGAETITAYPDAGGPSVTTINPLEDPRWSLFVESHPRATVFHSVAWIEALRRTYGYEPIAIVTCQPDASLRSAAVFCRVESRLTGRRLVSLPFSDHCDFLDGAPNDWAAIGSVLEDQLLQKKLRYVEIRPLLGLDFSTPGPLSTNTYYLHQIDLRPDLDSLFRAFHRDCTQRKIRRAERDGLRSEEGQSDFLLDIFYDLLVLTRRRHAVPTQPKKWFQSLIDCFGTALKIRVAFLDSKPVAAILTLRYQDTLLYKYGGSDARYHRLGGMHLLFWKAIQAAKRDGLSAFDLGRSECGNAGLVKFKDRWGAERSVIKYSRILVDAQSKGAFMPAGTSWKERMAKRLLPHLPDFVVSSMGGLIYRHIG